MASSRGRSKRARGTRTSAETGRSLERPEPARGAGRQPEQGGGLLAGRSAPELQSLVWSLFLALAFWCLAIVFYVSLQSDPNRVLYAAMAALLALLWSANFSLRLFRRRRR